MALLRTLVWCLCSTEFNSSFRTAGALDESVGKNLNCIPWSVRWKDICFLLPVLMTILYDFWNTPETPIIIAEALQCMQSAALQDEKTSEWF